MASEPSVDAWADDPSSAAWIDVPTPDAHGVHEGDSVDGTRLQTLDELRLALLEGDDVAQAEAFEQLRGRLASGATPAAALRATLLEVAERGDLAADALWYLPLEGATPDDLVRLRELAGGQRALTVREAAAHALGRADPTQAQLATRLLEDAYLAEGDPLQALELAAAAVRAARGGAAALIDRLARGPIAEDASVRHALARWRRAVDAGEVDPDRIFTAAAPLGG